MPRVNSIRCTARMRIRVIENCVSGLTSGPFKLNRPSRSIRMDRRPWDEPNRLSGQSPLCPTVTKTTPSEPVRYMAAINVPTDVIGGSHWPPAPAVPVSFPVGQLELLVRGGGCDDATKGRWRRGCSLACWPGGTFRDLLSRDFSRARGRWRWLRLRRLAAGRDGRPRRGPTARGGKKHEPTAARRGNSARIAAPSAQSVQTKKKPPVDLAISP
jgi:hypothetical protein